jgi:TRAP-type C4-dicarboxylate transport system permease small subunit
MLKWYDRVEEAIGKMLRAMCIFFLGVLLLVFIMNILDRLFHFTTMAWFEEIVTLCFAWMAFLGAAELWRGKSHFKVDFFIEKIKKKEGVALANFISDLIS